MTTKSMPLLAVGALVVLHLVAPAALPAKSARSLYEQARSAETRLRESKKLRSMKNEWQKVARQYRQVVTSHPQSGYCDESLFYEAQIHREIDERFRDRNAVVRALDSYLLLATGYPSSKWCKAARLARADLYWTRLGDEKAARREIEEILARWPKSQEAEQARQRLARIAGPAFSDSRLVPVRNIRHWTGKEYTRIVIDIDEEVKFREGRLAEPDRIYFDLLSATLSRDLAARSFPVEDGFLKRIRVAQNTADVVRIVLDFESISRYNVFSLLDPYRLVVDILGVRPEPASLVAQSAEPAPAIANPPVVEEPGNLAAGQPTSGEATPSSATSTPAAPSVGPLPQVEATTAEMLPPLPPEPTRDGRFPLARQLGLMARRVVIDPGHGGHDPGTTARSGLMEKDLVLDISRRVATLLEQTGEFEVQMTRNDDTFLPLEERTAIANSRAADLFVSIHANASRNRRARGIETYYLNLATSPEAEETAARENAVSTRRMGELQELLRQIMNNSRIAESSDFAHRVQSEMVQGALGSGSRSPRDLGVKTAPFYVLLGANMPSVLVEVSFLSNREDAQLLSDSDYRQKIAESIAQAIESYTASLKKVAGVRPGATAERVDEVSRKPKP